MMLENIIYKKTYPSYLFINKSFKTLELSYYIYYVPKDSSAINSIDDLVIYIEQNFKPKNNQKVELRKNLINLNFFSYSEKGNIYSITNFNNQNIQQVKKTTTYNTIYIPISGSNIVPEYKYIVILFLNVFDSNIYDLIEFHIIPKTVADKLANSNDYNYKIYNLNIINVQQSIYKQPLSQLRV